MLVGYARTSTLEQDAGLEAQVRDLKALGCERLFSEQVSSIGPRPQLEAVLGFVRGGDTLVVTKLDRLARSVAHLGALIDELEAKGVALRILNLGVDTATPTGKLMLNVLGGVAQFEREMMLERQREGIAKAKAEGAYKGRKPTARTKAAEVRALAAEGLSMSVIAAKLGIGKGSVHRALNPAGGGEVTMPVFSGPPKTMEEVQARLDAIPPGFTDWVHEMPPWPEGVPEVLGGDPDGPFAAPAAPAGKPNGAVGKARRPR